MIAISDSDNIARPARDMFLLRVNIICGILIMLSIPPSLFWGGATPTPMLLLLVIATGVIIDWWKKIGAGRLFVPMFASLVIVWLISFFAYLANGNSIPVVSGLSPHSSYGLAEAAGDSLFAPLISVPTFLGYSCNEWGVGPHCSNRLFLLGFVFIESVWVGGVVVGNLLVRRALKQGYEHEV